MKHTLIVLIIFSWCPCTSWATEYFYPIGIVPDGTNTKALCIHQDSNQKFHVYQYDALTDTLDQVLSGQYNPIDVQMLPDGSGFSFIENGMIKVKNFNKRSPRIIEIYEPLYAIANVQWIDAQICVFQAKRGQTYGIYTTDLEGNITTLVVDKNFHALYPQIIGSSLFYICARDGGNHSIIERSLLTKVQTEMHTSSTSLAYLTMIDSDCGYFISYNSTEYTLHLIDRLHLPNEDEWREGQLESRRIDDGIFFDYKLSCFSLCEKSPTVLPHLFKTNLDTDTFDDIADRLQEYYGVASREILRHPYSRFSSATKIFMRDAAKREFCFFGSPLLIGDMYLIGLAW